MGQIKLDNEQGSSFNFSENVLSSLGCRSTDLDILACMSSEGFAQLHLLVQAQALIRKNVLYEIISREQNSLSVFQPTVFNVLQYESVHYEDGEERDGQDLPLLSCHRDLAVRNMRFLSLFFELGPGSFALATNLIDRLLSRITVARRSLPVLATCCFYVAAKNCCSVSIDPNELLRLTHCDVTQAGFLYIAECIHNEFDTSQLRPVTPLSLFELFYEVFTLQDEFLQDQTVKDFMIMRLERLMCNFEFTKFRYDVFTLAFLHCFVQQIGRLDNTKQSTILELRFYCSMDEEMYKECFVLAAQYLNLYDTQPTKRPRLKLTWTISRRLLQKRKPSTHILSTLDPILEEEFRQETNADVPSSPLSEETQFESVDENSFLMDFLMDLDGTTSSDTKGSVVPQSNENDAERDYPGDSVIPFYEAGLCEVVEGGNRCHVINGGGFRSAILHAGRGVCGLNSSGSNDPIVEDDCVEEAYPDSDLSPVRVGEADHTDDDVNDDVISGQIQSINELQGEETMTTLVTSVDGRVLQEHQLQISADPLFKSRNHDAPLVTDDQQGAFDCIYPSEDDCVEKDDNDNLILVNSSGEVGSFDLHFISTTDGTSKVLLISDDNNNSQII